MQLTNRGASAQTDVPVTLEVRDAKGASVYRNDTKGIEASLQQIAELPAHATLWWVDDQILATAVPSAVVPAIALWWPRWRPIWALSCWVVSQPLAASATSAQSGAAARLIRRRR